MDFEYFTFDKDSVITVTKSRREGDKTVTETTVIEVTEDFTIYNGRRKLKTR